MTTDSLSAASLSIRCESGVNGNVLTTFRLVDTLMSCLSKCSQIFSISEQTYLVTDSSSSLYDVRRCDKCMLSLDHISRKNGHDTVASCSDTIRILQVSGLLAYYF